MQEQERFIPPEERGPGEGEVDNQTPDKTEQEEGEELEKKKISLELCRKLQAEIERSAKIIEKDDIPERDLLANAHHLYMGEGDITTLLEDILNKSQEGEEFIEAQTKDQEHLALALRKFSGWLDNPQRSPADLLFVKKGRLILWSNAEDPLKRSKE